MCYSDEWCNCQAIEGAQNYPGPWHPKGDVTCEQKDNTISVEAGIE